MAAEPGVLATFLDPASAARAIEALRAAGYRVDAAMPAPYPDVMVALGKRRSRIGRVTFAGALLGFAAGVGLTVGTSLAWPLVTGGKPVASWPPFVVIVFEVTVLIGSLVNLGVMAAAATLGARAQRRLVRPDAIGDRVSVLATGRAPDAARRILREGGAEEVRDEA